MIIINIMISSIQSFSDFASVDLKNLLKTCHHAALNENIRSACIDVERKERQCILLQTRMKVVKHELSFIILDEIQSIINDMKILQKQQNYLKMYIQHETLFIENITLLKNLNQTFYMLNFDYFLTWWSHASDCLELKFRKRIIIKVIKNSFINDDFFKKRTITFKIILLNKFSEEKKFKFIIDKNLKLFLRKLKLNFIKMNYIKDDDKFDYVTKYVKIMMMHYLQQIEKTVKKKDHSVKIMSRASHRDQVNQADESGKWEFKAKERDLRRCEDYMYREKKSAKLDRVLGSLQSARAEHARNITFFSQSSNDLIASISFFLSCSFHRAFQAHFIKRLKLISSGVSSLFLLDIERFKLIRRFKPISSYWMSLKQTHFWFESTT